MPKIEKYFCPQNILDTAKLVNAPYMNNGAPIWIDFNPGAFKNFQGETSLELVIKEEYVNKKLIRDLFERFLKNKEEREQVAEALAYFLCN